MMKDSGSCSSNKPTIIIGSVYYKCQRMFNYRSSFKKHHDHVSRACVPRYAGLVQVAAPGTLILLVAAAHDTVIGAPPCCCTRPQNVSFCIRSRCPRWHVSQQYGSVFAEVTSNCGKKEVVSKKTANKLLPLLQQAVEQSLGCAGVDHELDHSVTMQVS
jgi:hypothetical protein